MCPAPCLAEEARRDLAEVRALLPKAPRMRVIIERTADAYGVEAVELLRHRRLRRLAEARHAAMALCHELCGHSASRIGRAFDRDHTTILHALARHAARLADPDYAARITALRERLLREGTDHDA
jgi:chromosomal replication initiator protein